MRSTTAAIAICVVAFMLGLTAGVATAPAERHLFNAYDLLARCESASQVKRAECVGYLNGVLSGASEADLERDSGKSKVICFPWPHPTAEQFRPIFTKWVRSLDAVDHSQAMDIANTDAAFGVLEAWRAMSQCDKRTAP
jgi:hypothetical protein